MVDMCTSTLLMSRLLCFWFFLGALGVRDLLSQDIYVHKDLNDRVALLNATLPKAVKVRCSRFIFGSSPVLILFS